jgi:hypothetical protein
MAGGDYPLLNLFKRRESIPIEKKDRGPGLERGFKVGELFPIKGIWFRIQLVEFDKITLKAESATGRVKKWQRSH